MQDRSQPNSATEQPKGSAPGSTKNAPMISLFAGALGLDLGLESAGFDLRAAVEVNRWAVETIEMNRPDVDVIDRRIEDVRTDEILKRAGLQAGEALVVAAGPSCQTFSTAGHRRSVGDDRGWLFKHFLRVVTEGRPRFFVMENVRGVLSAAVQHRPLAEADLDILPWRTTNSMVPRSG